MPKSNTPIPSGFHTVTPHLTIMGGAAKYIDFLKTAFNAVEVSRSPGPDGKLMHAHVKIGDSNLMFNDHFPEFGVTFVEGNWPVVFHMYVRNVDEVFNQAVAAGCKATMPVADQFWGDRYGQVRDPFGFNWAIATHIEDPTPEEIREREAKMFGSGH